jgi:hypothetical protein
MKNSENYDSIDKKNFFFGTVLSSPWAILATWLYIGAPQKIHEK